MNEEDNIGNLYNLMYRIEVDWIITALDNFFVGYIRVALGHTTSTVHINVSDEKIIEHD